MAEAAFAPPAASHWIEKLGLHRPELRAWAMYDWANSGMAATIVTAVFPIYYAQVACHGLPETIATQRHALSTALALIVVAAAAPFLGALADTRALKKKLLAAFLTLGAGACAAMFMLREGHWLLGSVLFMLANIGASASFVFYDSLLPHIARPDEVDRVSTAGYALGYLGGGLLLGLNLAWIVSPHWFGLPSGPGLTADQATLPARLAFLSVGVWWVLFSIPLFRKVREPVPQTRSQAHAWRTTGAQLRDTWGALRQHRQAVLMLLAFLVYNDGVLTIIRMATIYGTEIGLPRNQLLLAVLAVNFVGVPFTFLFGMLAGWIGVKNSLFLALVVFAAISFLGFRMSTASEFYILAGLVAMVLGGTQALSRSLFASLIPKHRSSEFFGFFAVAEKFAGILGPAVFAILIQLTGSSRAAMLSVLVFFVIGALLLGRVDVESGRRAAEAADAPPVQARLKPQPATP